MCAALLALSAGCGAPRWQVTERDPGGVLLVDGLVVRPSAEIDDATDASRLDRTIPYHGSVDVALVPDPVPPSDNPSAPPLPYSSVRADVPIPPPITPWLFPLDFPLELLLLPFGPDDDVVARAALQPGRRVDAVPAGPEDDFDASGLRARARAAVRER